MKSWFALVLGISSLSASAREFTLWDGTRSLETGTDAVSYGTVHEVVSTRTVAGFRGTPDPWHGPTIKLLSDLWRINLSDYSEIRFFARTSEPGHPHTFSMSGWYMGASSSANISDWIENASLDTEFREVIVPLSTLQQNGCSLDSVEYLHFGNGEANHTIDIHQIEAVKDDGEALVLWTAESDEGLQYGTLAEFDVVDGSSFVFAGQPDPWHAPTVTLQQDAWRIDLNDYACVAFDVRLSEAGHSHGFSVGGWYIGTSGLVDIAACIDGGVLDTEWRTAQIPVDTLRGSGSLHAVEYLYFGNAEANHQIEIRDVRAVPYAAPELVVDSLEIATNVGKATTLAATTDADTINWQLISQQESATIADPDAPATTVTFSQPGTYQILVTAGNSRETTTQTIQVHVYAATLLSQLAGNFPLSTPDTNGIEQLMVLSNQCLIVITDPQEKIVAAMDALTAGSYSDVIAQTQAALANNRTSDYWTLTQQLEEMRWQHWPDARLNAGELALKSPSTYAVTSDSDDNYAQPKSPAQATTSLVSADCGIAPGYDSVRYGVYSYLILPDAMQNGSRYTITLDDGRSVSFTYDENTTLARSIKINQFGYQPGRNSNFAYVGAYLQDLGPLDLSHIDRFEVVDTITGTTAWSGSIADGRLALRDAMSRMDTHSNDGGDVRPYKTGETLYQLDLSGLVTPGTYFIRIPGVGRSWPFKVNADVFAEAFYTAVRGLYHQRASFALAEPCTAWTRDRFHTAPVYESEMVPYWADSTKATLTSTGATTGWPRFDIIGATTDTSSQTENVVGGWYDAADYDRNLYHYNLVFDLLKLHELNPGKFTDGQLNIPESGNGIPDILDEAEFGLRVWKHSQRADGGVAGILETNTHPSIDDESVLWSFSRRSRWSSLIYAAAAAELALAVSPYDSEMADTYQQSALLAYQFGTDTTNTLANLTVNAAANRGTGDPYTLEFSETDDHSDKFIAMAKARLFLLTDDDSYLDGLADLLADAPSPYGWPLSIRDFSPWLYFDILTHPQLAATLPADTANRLKTAYLSPADDFADLADSMPYRMTWPPHQDFWMSWGESDVTNRSKAMLIANAIEPDPLYLQASRSNVDYMFGANPMGMSWTTGIGYSYPVAIQHESSDEDDILDPYPGITLYGNTSNHAFPELKSRIWKYPTTLGSDGEPLFDSENPDDWQEFHTLPDSYPVFRRWAAHPYLNVAQNEFTIHETMSSTIFSLGMLMDSGWTPDANLIHRGPTPAEELFGYWYLP
ncbi:MAG: glycoside hydrolase family 9 protein [Verrucomicrobiales bacterium]